MTEATNKMPTWAKVLLIAFLVIVAAFQGYHELLALSAYSWSLI